MTKDDLNSLVWPAMRYALGQKTYVVDTVCSALINNARNIRPDIRDRMMQEMSQVISESHAGMDIDAKRWKDVLIAFQKVSLDEMIE